MMDGERNGLPPTTRSDDDDDDVAQNWSFPVTTNYRPTYSYSKYIQLIPDVRAIWSRAAKLVRGQNDSFTPFELPCEYRKLNVFPLFLSSWTYAYDSVVYDSHAVSGSVSQLYRPIGLTYMNRQSCMVFYITVGYFPVRRRPWLIDTPQRRASWAKKVGDRKLHISDKGD